MKRKKSRMTRRKATRRTIFQLLLTLLMAVLLFVRSDAPNGDDFLAPIRRSGQRRPPHLFHPLI